MKSTNDRAAIIVPWYSQLGDKITTFFGQFGEISPNLSSKLKCRIESQLGNRSQIF